ncbi:MAG: response regulator [Hyphomonadaceae bacterium]|nr:response regulator [Hyphomonadaceae bacterium]
MARSPTAAQPTILLVDDDRAVLSAIAFALATDGLDVAGFANAEAALAARPRQVACVIVDEKLPGLSGLDLVDSLRRDGVAAPAILITTAPSAALRRRARR